MSSDSSAVVKSSTPAVVPLLELRESATNPRKHFDAKSLAELAASIKEHGILEPLLVRTTATPGTIEIVCGARRYRASKIAKLSEVPVIFREFSDDDVAIVQLVENGQRADISPIEEADTYADLAGKGLPVSEIAKRIGRHTREVARRLPLASLPKRVKQTLSSGTLPLEHAELIARIPDGKLQEEALQRILQEEYFVESEKPFVRAVPYALAKRIVEEEFMTALSLAVFDPEDASLSPLGACSTCAHLAGNNPDLFNDVKGKAVCTNPKDFRAKSEAQLKRLRAAGHAVLITPKEVKRAFPYGESDRLGKDFLDLEAVCPQDPKHRRYEELLGRSAKLKTVLALKNGRVRKIFPAKAMKTALITSGHSFAKDKPKRVNDTRAAVPEPNLDRIGREAIACELAAKLRTVRLTPSAWIDLLLRIAVARDPWRVEDVLRRYGYEGSKEAFAKDRERILTERFETMLDAEKRAFLVDLLVGGWYESVEKAEREIYRYILKVAGVDDAKVANRAIDKAKQEAQNAKATPKAPIAAKSVRSAQVSAARQ